MKTLLNTMMIAAALVLAWGCRHDEKEEKSSTFTVSSRPDWQVDLTSDEGVPSWTAPDPSQFESSVFIRLRLEDELAALSSDDDLMSVFIGGECRALSDVRNVSDDGGVYFILKIRGNSSTTETFLTLNYYSARLRQVFSILGRNNFVSGYTYGFDMDFVPPLLSGSSKYPVQCDLTVKMPATRPFNVKADDMVAVFSGDECRGAGLYGHSFTVYGKQEGETMQVRYYSVEKGGIYTLDNTFVLTKGESAYNLEF